VAARRRNKRATQTRTTTSRAITVRQPAPVVRVSVPRAAPAKRGGGKRRHHGSGGGALTTERMFGAALGGGVLGLVDKMFPNLPTIPVLGKAGTLAALAYFFAKGKGSGIARDAAIAGASIAGYQLGTQGKISGDLMGIGDVVPQVTGVASQV
jgi:hypothetical protein